MVRTSPTARGKTTSYRWDVAVGLPVVFQDVTSTYVYGHGLISQTGGSGAQAYFLSNGLGSTEALTDGAGNITATYKYDVFGEVRSSTGTGSTEFRFTGQQDDATLGYTYLRARYYDPATGRFLSKDPFPGVVENPSSQHYYSYVQNNPVNWTDPSGECIGPFALACVAIAGNPQVVVLAAGGLALWASVNLQQHQADLQAFGQYCSVSLRAAVEGLRTFFVKNTEGAKSDEQKRNERDVWKEATKGLSQAERQRIHNNLEKLKGGARNADPADILAKREALFPNKSYPGGWLDSHLDE